jgi:hypothetical protein
MNLYMFLNAPVVGPASSETALLEFDIMFWLCPLDSLSVESSPSAYLCILESSGLPWIGPA